MSDAVGVKRPATPWEAPAVKALDEAVWQAWIVKGRARDRQGRETLMNALKWGSIVALLAVAGLGSQLTSSYDIAIRCVLAAAAVGVMFEIFHKRQRALVIASAIPVVPSLASRDPKAAHID